MSRVIASWKATRNSERQAQKLYTNWATVDMPTACMVRGELCLAIFPFVIAPSDNGPVIVEHRQDSRWVPRANITFQDEIKEPNDA